MLIIVMIGFIVYYSANKIFLKEFNFNFIFSISASLFLFLVLTEYLLYFFKFKYTIKDCLVEGIQIFKHFVSRIKFERV